MDGIKYASDDGKTYIFDGENWNNGSLIPSAAFIAADWLPVQQELLRIHAITTKEFLMGDPIDMKKPAESGYLFYLVHKGSGRIHKTSKLSLIVEEDTSQRKEVRIGSTDQTH